ncbi:MAG: hypothetical protein JW751_27035 [Polyangiaceae bacterium]|nr:hypothetical protein [Polyangiaceae bacterium]
MSGHGGVWPGGVAGSSAGKGGAESGGCGNVENDPRHCGDCWTVCPTGAECIEGLCVASPCDGLCQPTSPVNLEPGEGYKQSNIGEGAICDEVRGYDPSPKDPSLVCWQLDASRTLKLNGVSWQCDGVGHYFDLPSRAGGFCVHVDAGPGLYAGFEFPN